MNLTDYNLIPVYYCKRCLSLRVLTVPKLLDSEYCDECGSTDVAQTTIEEWERLYKERYGHYFLNNKY